MSACNFTCLTKSCVSVCVCVSSADEPVGECLLQQQCGCCTVGLVIFNCERQTHWQPAGRNLLISVRMEPLQVSAWAALSLEVLGEVVLCVSEHFIERGTGLPAFQLVCRSWLQAASQSIAVACCLKCRSSWHLQVAMNMQDHQSSICSYVRKQLICRLVQYSNSTMLLKA